MNFGPRPTGTDAHRKLGDYIMAQLKQLGWQVEEQPFEYLGVKARNIIAKQGAGPIIILGAHYDTRRQADHRGADEDVPPAQGSRDRRLLELRRQAEDQEAQDQGP